MLTLVCVSVCLEPECVDSPLGVICVVCGVGVFIAGFFDIFFST